MVESWLNHGGVHVSGWGSRFCAFYRIHNKQSKLSLDLTLTLTKGNCEGSQCSDYMSTVHSFAY